MNFELKCRRLLYTLVTTLVFEGIVRKLLPIAAGTFLFFLKDILCVFAIILTYKKYAYSEVVLIKQKWINISIAFVPVLIVTFVHDPILLIFGAKQYLLYCVVALLFYFSFIQNGFFHLKMFLHYLSILLVVTTAVAIVQNQSPATSWINTSVQGTSLENFAAAGYLRVSSTFSFTGQYSWFLNLMCPMLVVYLLLVRNPWGNLRSLNYFYKLLLIGCFTVSIYITGGRTAVLGSSFALLIGFILICLRNPRLAIMRSLPLIVFIIALLTLIKSYKPDFFAAYEERSKGFDGMTQEEEIGGRISGGLTKWNTWIWNEDIPSILMGNGLGVMSNGSDQLSAYAKEIRKDGTWTEDDMSTVFWEGGLYLAIIWYGFRLSVILLCFRICRSLRSFTLYCCGAILFSYILITGTIGTISIQPPLAIWWWLSIGTLIVLKQIEKGQTEEQTTLA